MMTYQEFLNFDLEVHEAGRAGEIQAQISRMPVSGPDNDVPELIAMLIVRLERIERDVNSLRDWAGIT